MYKVKFFEKNYSVKSITQRKWNRIKNIIIIAAVLYAAPNCSKFKIYNDDKFLKYATYSYCGLKKCKDFYEKSNPNEKIEVKIIRPENGNQLILNMASIEGCVIAGSDYYDVKDYEEDLVLSEEQLKRIAKENNSTFVLYQIFDTEYEEKYDKALRRYVPVRQVGWHRYHSITLFVDKKNLEICPKIDIWKS